MQRSYQKVRIILQIAAFSTLIIGVGTLLFPDLIVSWFDGTSGESNHFVRFIGTALIGFSVANWLCSRLPDLSHALPVIYGNFTSLVLAILVDLIGLALNLLSGAVWIILLVHFSFALAFWYCIRLIASAATTK
ncbi:MAG: hypothetical protein M3Q14_01950 [bacterium]|nr:hypothetical protein [bacterium]